jgi:hypothetical protein
LIFFTKIRVLGRMEEGSWRIEVMEVDGQG